MRLAVAVGFSFVIWTRSGACCLTGYFIKRIFIHRDFFGVGFLPCFRAWLSTKTLAR